MPTSIWMSIGVRFVEREDNELYKRHRGMLEVQTNFRRASGENIPILFVTIRGIVESLEHNRGRKVSLAFTRLHWLPSNEQPRR
jgi:hypothetical protein